MISDDDAVSDSEFIQACLRVEAAGTNGSLRFVDDQNLRFLTLFTHAFTPYVFSILNFYRLL